jgi:hypothetical protein
VFESMTFGELSEGGRGEDRRLERRRKSGVGRAVQAVTASPGINGVVTIDPSIELGFQG